MNITPDLINKAAAGDQGAITCLYEQTYSSVYKTVRAMIRDEDAVLDILQDSYIKGFQSLQQLDSPDSFPAWMKRIAVNKAKDYMKKNKPLLFTELENPEGELPEFRDECPEHMPEVVLDRQETVRLMREILDSLSEDQRLVIGMYYYQQMSVKEIAAMLDCPENTVKSRLNYGRKKVETKVRDLEKKGVKLYSLAPLAFLLWLFRLDAEAAVEPSQRVLQGITAQNTAGAVASAGAKGIAVKLVAGAAAVALVGCVVGGAIFGKKTPAPAQPSVTETAGQVTSVETPAPTQIADPDQAYEEILELYREACSVDHGQWMENLEEYNDRYSDLFTDTLMTYHMLEGMDAFYMARYDLDGNGVEELFIGYGPEPSNAYLVGAYGFDGEGAVSLTGVAIEVLADGTILLMGNSGAVERVTRLADDGYMLEILETDITPGSMVTEQAYVAHGGLLQFHWEKF